MGFNSGVKGLKHVHLIRYRTVHSHHACYKCWYI